MENNIQQVIDTLNAQLAELREYVYSNVPRKGDEPEECKYVALRQAMNEIEAQIENLTDDDFLAH